MTNRFLFKDSAKIFALLVLLATASAAAQQADTLREFGAVVTKVSTLRNGTALIIGGRGGWIIDRAYAVGIEGYMLMNNIEARIPDTSGNHLLTFSYGGLDLEYSPSLGNSFSWTLQVLVGAGSIGHKEIPYLDRRQYHDPFFVLEPSLTVEMGLMKILRLGFGAGYRGVGGLKSALASGKELSGPSASLSLKIGFL